MKISVLWHIPEKVPTIFPKRLSTFRQHKYFRRRLSIIGRVQQPNRTQKFLRLQSKTTFNRVAMVMIISRGARWGTQRWCQCPTCRCSASQPRPAGRQGAWWTGQTRESTALPGLEICSADHLSQRPVLVGTSLIFIRTLPGLQMDKPLWPELLCQGDSIDYTTALTAAN